MKLRQVLDLVNKEKRKNELVKVAKKFALGIGVAAGLGVVTGVLCTLKLVKEKREYLKKKTVDTVDAIGCTIKNTAELVKHSATDVAHEVSDSIKDVSGKTEEVKKDIKDGCHEVAHDIHKTAENIVYEINKNSK